MSPSVHIVLSAEMLVHICDGRWGEVEVSSPCCW